MAKKKTEFYNGHGWKYMYVNDYGQVLVSESVFISKEKAEARFLTLKDEGNLEDCKLLGFNPVYQTIHSE